MSALSLAFSPCPNDTYIFHALVKGCIDIEGFSVSSVAYEDVETLNLMAMGAQKDITKLSFHALGHVLDSYKLLCSGSALGRGCGPLLVCKKTKSLEALTNPVIATPGKYTTASLLLKMCFPEYSNTKEMRFDQIMPAIVAGEVDAGVIIHESRFTYTQYGLQIIQDLGQWWEEETNHPIPLGGIVVRRDLGPSLIENVDRAVHKSIVWARKNPQKCKEYIKEYAQEIDDEVINSHINLYVNDFSLNLGVNGLAAVKEFLDRGNDCGAFKGSGLQVHDIC